VKPTLRVETVAEREQIGLVGSATVVQQEQARRPACRGPLPEREIGHRRIMHAPAVSASTPDRDSRL
jgi:hypothetical protein